jgi:hypothetical protein
MRWASRTGKIAKREAIQEKLRKHDVRLERDLILKINRRPYLNAEIFLNHIRTLFLPYLGGFRGLVEFVPEDAVLFMDNYSAHATDDMICLVTEVRVHVTTFASHTTQIFHVHDLTLFCVLKRRPRYELPFENDNATVKVIMKMYHDFRPTMVSLNVWGAFHALGLDFHKRSESYQLFFNEKRLRETADLRDL